MSADLSFVSSPVHRRIIREILNEVERDDEVLGALIMGSVARGDATSQSDLDLMLLMESGCGREFESCMRRDILVEFHRPDFEQAKKKLETNPMWVYGYLDGRVLYDVEGMMGGLVSLAHDRYQGYEVRVEELLENSYWLKSARTKMMAAKSAGDDLKASFAASTTSWKIIEARWALNGWPVPPSGAVLPHLSDLSTTPSDFRSKIDRLFLGDSSGRVIAAIEMIDWIVADSRRD